MPFSDFHGNTAAVTLLREMLSRDRFPHAVILSGPPGAGKYTLAQMVAKTMNCLEPPKSDLPDFCGRCSNCTRIAEADDLEARFDEAVEARENLRDADKRETRIFVQTHPDVLVIPPDPPQMLIKMDQVRRVIETIYYRPSQGGRRVYIFTDSSFMKEAANSLLKVLEEPPEFATLFLLSCNPGQLLPTIRSRCVSVALAALPVDELENDLASSCSDWPPGQRALAARLAEGAVGRARRFDLESYAAARNDALTILRSAVTANDHSALFKVTETYRAGADGQEKTRRLLRALYSLLQDIAFLNGGTPELVRNTDIASDLKRLAGSVDFAWIAGAVERLGEVESGMRRNLLRSLSLDAFATTLDRS
jgi:DNA polymerase-3 subunit delta'